MAAYAAVAVLKKSMELRKTYFGMALTPIALEIVEKLIKELSWIEESIERMDVRRRMKMKASLEQIPELIEEYDAVLNEHGTGMEDLKQHTHSFLERLKKLVDDEEGFPILSRPEMVGLSDEFSKLKVNLVGEWEELPFNFLSLVGMAGIGKTALAKKIYKDLDILEWFDCCAWVTVGKIYQPEEIIRTILAQVDLHAHETPTEGFQEMVECLKESLEDKRYLIIFDDVWDIQLAQDYLKFLFPNNGNGSRVLLTTRIKHESDDDPFSYHHLRLLNKEESWHLLCEKIFDEGTCPPELEEAGKKIAEKCDGLPLTIITVADLLSKAEKTESFWNEVVAQKRHQVFMDAYDQISKVLYPSFEDLSDDLKLCFLYIGVFPQNHQMPKSKLINLWIVEKIIKKGSFQTLELSGVECLQYLALRSLIMVYQRSTLFSPTERVKTCGLHASWWHFCYKEARKINFFHVIDSYGDASRNNIRNQSRLTVHNNVLFGIKDVCKSIVENCASTAHTLLCLGSYHQYEVPICFNLKLLTKLDALQIRFYEFPLEVLKLVMLRYLALTCNKNLPSSISKLESLRYLIVHQHLSIRYSFEAISYLPMRIWNLKKLKHLHVMGRDIPHLGKSTVFRNLRTLLDVTLGSCTKDVINKIPNVKKLGIRIELMPDVIETLSLFENISNLSKLESLKCVIVNPVSKFEVVASLVPLPMFPLSLKKLYLNGLCYPWTEMKKISSLPNLQVLKLRCNAFQGPKWEIEADEFPRLTSLLLEDIDLEELEGEKESFKSLQKLSIKHCYKLKHFCLRGEDETVSNIEIVDSNPQAIRQIQVVLHAAIHKSPKLPNHFLIKSSWDSVTRNLDYKDLFRACLN